jgi:hypothetical protein
METAARAGGENIGSATALVTTIPRRKSRREGVPSLISCPSNIVASSNTRITREGERILSAQLATRSGVPANALVAWGEGFGSATFWGIAGQRHSGTDELHDAAGDRVPEKTPPHQTVPPRYADQNPSGRCERSDWRPTCPPPRTITREVQ